jgi:DNA invertase Pin-like site-specific DNA recombinase
MTSQRIGYIRVSSLDQYGERQLDGIHLDKAFTDKATGKDTNRPQLQAALNHIRAGDTL